MTSVYIVMCVLTSFAVESIWAILVSSFGHVVEVRNNDSYITGADGGCSPEHFLEISMGLSSEKQAKKLHSVHVKEKVGYCWDV